VQRREERSPKRRLPGRKYRGMEAVHRLLSYYFQLGSISSLRGKRLATQRALGESKGNMT